MKTREILKGALFLSGILMLAAACIKSVDQPKLDFDITVPSSWNYYALNSGNLVYYASSPLESQTDSILEDMMISKDLITGKNLEQFCAMVMDTLDNDTTYHQVYFSPDTTINGETCRKLIHLQTISFIKTDTRDTVDLHTKITRYFFVRNDYGYLVTMNALKSTYATYKSIFDTIISSFKFK
jgi:hypothetical protein